MHFIDANALVAKHFKYVSDNEKYKFREVWNVVDTTKEEWEGDCEDYSLTVMWFMSGQNILVFLYNLLFNTAFTIHHVNVKSNGVGHAVMQYNDMYVDNIMREWKVDGDEALEAYEFRFPWYPPLILIKIMIGLPFILYQIYLRK